MELKKQFNFLAKDIIVLYSGAIGEKQGLQALLHTAREMSQDRSVKFVICGSGPYKDKLIDMANELTLTNVYFLPLQPKEKFNQFLNMADVHLVMQKANENELFMPSKLTTICAVGGLVIVTASANTSLYDLVAGHQLGILIAPEDQEALTQTIKNAIYEKHDRIKSNARAFATEYLSIDQVVTKYFSEIHPDNALPVIPLNEKKTVSHSATSAALK